MLNQWAVWLTVTGFAFVVGNECDSTDARACYEDLVNYETIIFPLYGSNEAKLEDNCGNINSSFSCIVAYNETCYENVDCDANCTKFLKLINTFVRNTGLTTLYENLCEKGNALRQTYLENAECIEETADLYASCHNVSQESRDYIHNTPGASTVQAHCCYLAWYRDCFTNSTKGNCGENATFIVSVAVHYMIGAIAEQLCSSEPAFCEKPPLPPDEPMTDNEIDTNNPAENDLDKNKPHKNDKNLNSTTHNYKGAATTLYTSTMLVFPYVLNILIFIYTL